MKSHVTVLTKLLSELGSDCGANTDRDVAYVRSRIESEGEEFLTITLPTFEKSLLRSIDEGKISSDHFPGFARSGGLPKFLSGFLRNIFYPNGELRPTTPDLIRNIRAVRQFCLLLSKFEGDCTPKRVKAALDNYVAVDAQIPDSFMFDIFDAELGWGYGFQGKQNILAKDVQVCFDALFGSFFRDLESGYTSSPFFEGGHGPGAVAGKEGNNERWSFTTWTDRLERVLPYADSVSCNLHDWLDTAGGVLYLSRTQEPPVRVVTVPKTMKGPRVIAVEPAHMQYVQQGLLRQMSALLDLPKHAAIKRLLGWKDQEPNRALCRDWGNYATIDLKDASDRVPYSLVHYLVSSVTPRYWEVIDACRTRRSALPDGRNVDLWKFASMGSSLCFPIESIVFATLCVLTEYYGHILATGEAPFENPRSRRASRWIDSLKFRVFGDDIVFSRHLAPALVRNLEDFGLKVNKDKTFMNGKFRESCGMDWYDGYDVSVAKLRTAFPESRSETTSVIRAIEAHNRFYGKGFFGTAKEIENALQKVFAGSLPYVPDGSRALGFYTNQDDDRIRWSYDKRLHRHVHRAIVLRFVFREDHLEGYGALRKFFLPKSDQFVSAWDNDSIHLRDPYPSTDKDHLRFAGRPVHVTMHVRNVPV